jgi:5-methyltetrahydropteroyltriglutamate--homocysteine methyltransferase
MRSSRDRILTTHAGSLSRPENLIAMGRAVGKNEDNAAYANCLADAVADVVCKQRELGIDIPDDGEFGKPVAGSYDYGALWNYAFARMSGFSRAGSPEAAAHETQHKKSSVADVALTSFANRRDWQKFTFRMRCNRKCATLEVRQCSEWFGRGASPCRTKDRYGQI